MVWLARKEKLELRLRNPYQFYVKLEMQSKTAGKRILWRTPKTEIKHQSPENDGQETMSNSCRLGRLAGMRKDLFRE